MTAALQAVRWSGVVDELQVALPDHGNQVTAAILGARGVLPATHATLAALAAHAGPAIDRRAVGGHGGSDAVGDWLYRTARTALRLALPTVRDLPPAPPPHTPAGWLTVEDDLEALPLLDLLDAYATRAQRRLIVRRADLSPAAGRGGHHDGVALIELDYALTPRTWAGVWFHEFGHVVDPRIHERGSVGQEDYADEFSRSMRAGVAPANLDELDTLIRWADNAVPPPAPPTTAAAAGVDDLPTDGVCSVIAFLALPLTPGQE